MEVDHKVEGRRVSPTELTAIYTVSVNSDAGFPQACAEEHLAELPFFHVFNVQDRAEWRDPTATLLMQWEADERRMFRYKRQSSHK